MRAFLWSTTIGAALLIALASCGKRGVTQRASVLPPACEIQPAPGRAADSIVVALLDPVDPGRAPWAGNVSERLLFRHLYETLITIDCLGEVHPGLAKAWNRGKGGRRWTFELREGARFSDGTPVTALDVVSCWQDALTLDTLIDSATVAGERILHVYLKTRRRKVPRTLAASAFAVTRRTPGRPWPLGTGRYRVLTPTKSSSRAFGQTFTVRPAFDGSPAPVIRFVEMAPSDARDWLDGVVDVMVTADPGVIEYASRRTQLVTVALPWNRTYVLLATSRVRALRAGGKPGDLPADFRDRLARDAVRGDAQGYWPPSWWDDLYGCGRRSAADSGPGPFERNAGSPPRVRRILYDSGDGIARDLAERIVALSAVDPNVSSDAGSIFDAVPGLAGDGSGIMAEGVGVRELDASLRKGADFAYVISVVRRPLDPCYEAAELLDRVPWLFAEGIELDASLIPLVDTRLHVIARRGRTRLTADGYGNVRIANDAWWER